MHATICIYSAEQRKLPEVQQILSAIERAVDDINEKYDKPYKIETSIGVGRLSKNIRLGTGACLLQMKIFTDRRSRHMERHVTLINKLRLFTMENI